MRHQTPPFNIYNSGTVLHVDDYVTLLADFDGIIVRMIRSSAPHPSVRAMEESYLEVARAFDRYGRSGRCLLVDARNIGGRNDPDYDAAFRRARERIDAGLLRIAVLLRSQTGMLQLMRLSEEDGTVRLLTMNENDAIEYLRYGTVPTVARPAATKKQAK